MSPAEYKCESLKIKISTPEHKAFEHKFESLNINVNLE